MKTKRVFAALLLTGAVLTHSSFAQNWSWQNPLPQGNNLIGISFSDSLKGTAVGDVGKILRTTDGGATWSTQPSGTLHWLAGVCFTDSNTGTAVGESGTILRTTNGGASWALQQSTLGETHLQSVWFLDSTNGWAVGGSGTVIHTSDGGVIWTIQPSGSTKTLKGVTFTSLNTGFVVGFDGEILRTTDGGTTWINIPSGTTRALYGVSFSDSMTGIAAGFVGTILRTTDGGLSWVDQSPGSTSDYQSVSMVDANTATVWGSFGEIRHTTDGGVNWVIQPAPTTLTMRNGKMTNANMGVCIGDWGKTLRTTDGGTTWIDQSYGTTNDMHSISFADPNNGFAVGNGGTIVRTTDGGTTWITQNSRTTNLLLGVCFTDPTTGTAVGLGGVIRRTTNGGALWTLQTSGTTNQLESVCFTDANNGTIAGDFGTILHTTNGGATWVTQVSGTGYDLYGVSFTDAINGTVVGNHGTILHTTNGGTTWVPQTSPTINRFFAVSFTDVNTGTASGALGTFAHTTDGGATWIGQASGKSNSLFSVSFTDANTGVAVGAFGSIFRTTNGGTNWVSQTSGTTNGVFGVAFVDANSGSLVGNGGTILHTATGGTGVQPPVAPTLVSPLNGGGAPENPTLSWDASPGALWYTVQISNTPYFKTIIMNQTGISTNSYSPPGLQTGSTYYWRVSVRDSSGTSSWSETWSFTVALLPQQVALISPGDGMLVFNDSLSLLWNKGFPDIDRYWFEYGTDSTFTTSTVDSTVIDTTTMIVQLPHYQYHWWRVRAHNSIGWGSFSETRSFFVFLTTPSTPELVSPPDSAMGVSLDLTLNWNAAIGAEAYAVQLSDTEDFSRFVVDEDSLDVNLLNVTDLFSNGTYYWRVRARNILGSGPWSETWRFSTILLLPSQVSLLSPANGVTILAENTTLVWSSTQPQIDRYWVERGTDSTFAVSTVDSMVTDTVLTVQGLQDHQTYYWKVRAHNATGWGPFSSERNFSVVSSAPISPLLLSPPDGAMNRPLTLSLNWHAVTAQLLYQIAGNEGSLIRTGSRHQEEGSGLYGGKKSGSVVSGSRIPAGKGGAMLENSTPLSLSTDTVFYYIQVALDSSFVNLVVDNPSVVDTNYQVGPLLNGTTYYWHVQASNAFGASGWSETWNFRTLVSIPSQVVLLLPVDGTVVTTDSVAFIWYAGQPEIDRYWFEYSRDSLFAVSIIDSTLPDTTEMSSRLRDSEKYWWRARAHNAAGWGEFSATFTFSVIITGVESAQELPGEFSLSQNYPNPFNPSTTIKYALPQSARVKLEVFNLIGERVSVLVDDEQQAGYHQVTFERAALASGIYFYRLQAGSFTETKRLILLR